MKNAAVVLVLFSFGCASVAHQTTQMIPVTSDPSGAEVSVNCGKVTNEPNLVTPAMVRVQRKAQTCVISVAKEGYQAWTVELEKRMSGWYFGNIVLGGIPGFIIDAVDGAMYNRTPGVVDAKLTPNRVASASH